MHNTKEVIESDETLHALMRTGVTSKYLYFGKKQYGSPAELTAAVSMADKPCILV